MHWMSKQGRSKLRQQKSIFFNYFLPWTFIATNECSQLSTVGCFLDIATICYFGVCGRWLTTCFLYSGPSLTHWGRATHIYVGNLTIISSDNGLSPGRRQAIIWTNVGILLIGPIGTNFSEILIEIYTFSSKKMHLKMSSGPSGHLVSASMC